MPELSTTISIVPPCSADTLAASPPSVPPGKRLTFILPPLLAATSSANFSAPMLQRMALRVLQRELEAALLDVLRQRGAERQQRRATAATDGARRVNRIM